MNDWRVTIQTRIFVYIYKNFSLIKATGQIMHLKFIILVFLVTILKEIIGEYTSSEYLRRLGSRSDSEAKKIRTTYTGSCDDLFNEIQPKIEFNTSYFSNFSLIIGE